MLDVRDNRDIRGQYKPWKGNIFVDRIRVTSSALRHDKPILETVLVHTGGFSCFRRLVLAWNDAFVCILGWISELERKQCDSLSPYTSSL